MRDQMFFDYGPESFLSEVGQILVIKRLNLSIYGEIVEPLHSVQMTFDGYKPGHKSDPWIHVSVGGRSYGECLRKIREQIRERTGR